MGLNRYKTSKIFALILLFYYTRFHFSCTTIAYRLKQVSSKLCRSRYNLDTSP